LFIYIEIAAARQQYRISFF